MFLQICVLIRSKSKKQSFLAAITRFNDQSLSFNRWFTRSVVVSVDLKVAWNGWVSKNTRRAAICWELWMRHWLSWAFSGLRFRTDYGTDSLQLSRIQTWVVVDTLYVSWPKICVMCVGGTWLSFSFCGIIVFRAEWFVIFSLFVKFAFTDIVFIIAYRLLTPTAVLMNQACVSFLSLTLFRAR